jgi:hypothetical protein
MSTAACAVVEQCLAWIKPFITVCKCSHRVILETGEWYRARRRIGFGCKFKQLGLASLQHLKPPFGRLSRYEGTQDCRILNLQGYKQVITTILPHQRAPGCSAAAQYCTSATRSLPVGICCTHVHKTFCTAHSCSLENKSADPHKLEHDLQHNHCINCCARSILRCIMPQASDV